MANYSFGQLQTLWIKAGGSKTMAPLMAAIALAESGGNPLAAYPGTTVAPGQGRNDDATGLWQILGVPPGFTTAQLTDPLENAKMAVWKLKTQGLGAWQTYPNPALAILKAHGGQPPAALPGGSSGTAAGAAPATATLDIANPISIIKGITSAAGSLGSLVSGVNTFLSDIEWLFVPSHWIRVFAGLAGVTFEIAGAWALMKAGQGSGDITLAVGIMLVTFGGILLFIAFHSLDPSIKDLSGLLGAISKSIQAGSNQLGQAG